MFPIMFKSSLDWDLLGEPEPGLDGRRLYLPRGRMIGGCSSINAMIYLRGNRLDYDDWAAEGCAGWSYDEVLPYFKRGEDNERGEDAFHGVGGPQTRLRQPLACTRSSTRCSRRPSRRATSANPDLNGAVQDGVGRFQLTQRGGLRCSTADAYLHPAAEPAEPRGAGLLVRRADRLRGRSRRRRRRRPERRRARRSAPSER